MSASLAPRVEGTVDVGGGRRIGFAEFGEPTGRAVFWMHGTPGGRRQIPVEARAFAVSEGLRIIGVDRPGIGASTPTMYSCIRDFADDLACVADALGVGRFCTVGLSGGGPYALAAAAADPGRVPVVGVLGGVAPTRGPDAIDGGLVSAGVRLAPLLSAGRVPLGALLCGVIRAAAPIASPGLDLFARLSPAGDRLLLSRPDFKAMFLDDLLRAARRQMSAPLADVVLFTRHWGFEAADVSSAVVWWHGDADHIIPYTHGEHMVGRLGSAELRTLSGESHLGGLGVAAEVLSTLVERWDGSRPVRLDEDGPGTSSRAG